MWVRRTLCLMTVAALGGGPGAATVIQQSVRPDPHDRLHGPPEGLSQCQNPRPLHRLSRAGPLPTLLRTQSRPDGAAVRSLTLGGGGVGIASPRSC